MNAKAAAAALLFASAASASSGLQIGLRTGAAIPAGAVGGKPRVYLSDLFSAGIPLQGELLYRFDDFVSLGAFASYDVLQAKSCPPQASCSGRSVRVGIELQAHPLGAARIDPWGGVGFGYAWTTSSETAGGVSADLSIRGFDLATIGAGVDFALGPLLRIGPFATLALGTYDHVEVSGAGSAPIANQTVHEWVMLGVRTSLRL